LRTWQGKPQNNKPMSAAESAAKAVNEYYKKKYPYSSMYSHTAEELDIIKRKFNWWYVLVFILQFLFLALITLAAARIFYALYIAAFDLFKSSQTPFFHYSWVAFCFPGFFLATAIFVYPLELVQKILMGSMYPIYQDYYNSTKGYDNAKAGQHFTGVCWCILPIVLLPVITSGVLIDKSTFSIKHFYSFYPKHYDIKQVEQILFYTHYTDRSKRAHFSPHYIIAFKEQGKVLTTVNWEYDDTSIVRFANLLNGHGIKIDSMGVDVDGAATF
jgi:hypothetical protein